MGFIRDSILPPLNCLASRMVDYPFAPIPNQVAISPKHQEIPNNVIQTWEENSFGKRHLKSMKEFRKLNSDLNFQLYDSNTRDQYMRQAWGSHPIYEIYVRATFGALRADLFRYCIIYDQGGYYFDISKGLDTSISSLHQASDTGFISFEGNDAPMQAPPAVEAQLIQPRKLVIQWAFGFSPRHEILSILILDLVERFPSYEGEQFAIPKNAIIDFSGPRAITRALHKYLEANTTHGLAQLDIDFNGHGIYSLRGSGARHHKYPSYATVQNSRLFSEPTY